MFVCYMFKYNVSSGLQLGFGVSAQYL